jgi:hypothetical protein
MSPKRLSEMGGTFGAQLLRAAKSDAPPKGSDERTLAALGVAALGTSALFASGWSRHWLLKLGGVALLVSAPAVLYEIAHRPIAPHPATITVRSAPSPAAPRSIDVTPAIDARDLPSVAPPPIAPSAERSTAKRPRTPTLTVAPALAPPAAPLASELDLLRAAKGALESHDPAAALAILDRHAKLYPRPVLGEESTVVRVDALVAAVDPRHAAEIARRFLQDHPKSAYAQRLRSLLERLRDRP